MLLAGLIALSVLTLRLLLAGLPARALLLALLPPRLLAHARRFFEPAAQLLHLVQRLSQAFLPTVAAALSQSFRFEQAVAQLP